MSSIRKTFIAVAGIAAMGAASLAYPGSLGSFGDQRGSSGGSSSSGSESSAPSYSPAPVFASAPVAAPVQRTRESAPARSSPQPRNESPRAERQEVERAAGPRQSNRNSDPRISGSQPAPSAASPRQRVQAESSPGPGNRDGAPAASGAEKKRNGVIGGAINRNYRPDSPGNNNGGNSQHDHDHDHDGDHNQHNRPPRVVYVLPPVYSDYYWNNNWYYNFDGGWYSPYGNGYISVGAPYGMYVRSLPGYSSSFYYGDVRYYLHDDTYYTYDRSRGGYVVTPSPNQDDDEANVVDEDLYIYPAQNQSEQQQADDRYECHRWAVKESGYDPIDDAYDRDRRANYLRAMTACLTARGYSVK